MFRRYFIFTCAVALAATVSAQSSSIDSNSSSSEKLLPSEQLLTGGSDTYTTPAEVVLFARFLPNGQLLTVGAEEGDLTPHCCGSFNGNRISTWNVDTGERIHLSSHNADLEQTEVSPNGRVLASWNTEECDHFADGCVRLYDLENNEHTFGRFQWTLGGPPANIQSVSFSPDSKRLAVSYRYNWYGGEGDTEKPEAYRKAIRVFDLTDFSEYCWLTTEDLVYPLLWSSDGRYLAARGAVDSDSFVYVWDVDSRKKLGKLPQDPNKIDFMFSDDSREIYVANETRSVAYGLPMDGGKLSGDGKPLAGKMVKSMMNPSGLTTSQTRTQVFIIDETSGKEVLTLYRKPGQTDPEDLEYTVNVGLLTRSDDGRFAVLDSQIVDLKSQTIRDLNIPRPESAFSLGVGVAPPGSGDRPIMQRRIY